MSVVSIVGWLEKQDLQTTCRITFAQRMCPYCAPPQPEAKHVIFHACFSLAGHSEVIVVIFAHFDIKRGRVYCLIVPRFDGRENGKRTSDSKNQKKWRKIAKVSSKTKKTEGKTKSRPKKTKKNYH